MAFGIIKNPGRWGTYCPEDGVDLCTLLSINDFEVTWNIDSALDRLTSVEVSVNPFGLVQSILTTPSGSVDEVPSTSAVTMNYNSGVWEPASTYSLDNQQFYSFSVTLSVKLNSFDTCSFTVTSTYQYIDLGSFPEAAPSISGVKQVGETLTGSDGYSDVDGDAQDTVNTIRRWYSYTDAAGTIDETYLGSGSTYTLTSSEKNKYIKYKVIPYALTGPSPGSEGTSLVYGPIATDVDSYTLTTEKNGVFTFVQTLSSTEAVGVDWGDGSAIETLSHSSAQSFSHTYSTGASKTVTIYVDPSKVTVLSAGNEEVTAADLSDLDKLQELILSSNLGLTSLTLPTSNTATWVGLYLNSTGISGTLDLSTLGSMPDTCNLQLCTALTSVNFPTGGTCTKLRIEGCNITGTLDFSGIDLGGSIRMSSNPLFTGFTLGSSSTPTTLLQAFNCGFTGTLDISALDVTGNVTLSGNSLTGLTYTASASLSTLLLHNNNFSSLDISGFTGLTTFQANGNSSLATLTLPASSGSLVKFRVEGCDLPYFDLTNLTLASNIDLRFDTNNMTTAEVNCMLVDVESIIPTTGTGSIEADGTNAAPDGSTGGCDGDAAVTTISGYGYSVFTT